MNDETRLNIPDEVSELSVPETRFDRQPQTHHKGHSGTAPETSRNTSGTSQATNGDDSQIDPHPEAGVFIDQTMQNSGPGDRHDTWSGHAYT